MSTISIITPMFNSEETIIETISSVLNQTYSDWEMIIVDDKSTDRSVEIVKSFTDNRIKLITSDIKLGAANARNKAMSYASGRYISFLDADDIWHQDKLKKQHNYMSKNDIYFSYTDYYIFKDNVNKHSGIFSTKDLITYQDLCFSCGIGCLTVMLDRLNIQKIHFPNIPKEDYAAWISILKNDITAYKCPGKLAYYRTSKTSLSGNKWKEIKKQYTVLRQIAKLNLPKTIISLIYYSINGLIKHHIYYKSK